MSASFASFTQAPNEGRYYSDYKNADQFADAEQWRRYGDSHPFGRPAEAREVGGGQAEERQDQAEAGQCGEKSHSGNAVRGWTDCMEKISSNPRFLDYNFSVRMRV